MEGAGGSFCLLVSSLLVMIVVISKDACDLVGRVCIRMRAMTREREE